MLAVARDRAGAAAVDGAAPTVGLDADPLLVGGATAALHLALQPAVGVLHALHFAFAGIGFAPRISGRVELRDEIGNGKSHGGEPAGKIVRLSPMRQATLRRAQRTH